ncbi:MAG TPA: hypothetical protein DEG17_20360 [Cyanobacteria bacterium UBA11149]|nr:hypothetical protein [Cyanobacteria bacterium UBA11367]HBE57708.1 hypothetical protein [Cyanobacteria bacterium UBA11366]HBK65378.1 hypothetical protein [Cyanobacteria bacterium UBA11166]HBR75822.1 hypothetical protein [Cyanobacteria bacterium UBA11159]HBS72315.1 hypothetical protein [Cyanobacteria bacterium UBA11153]HBW91149.1 hypothetical protein [Cyanobacteria bacterium UBA11149]HCA94390.1 hypothetical protein [Cyanobacteria bacterium UBA9226]
MDLSEEFYAWLAHSQFSKIAQAKSTLLELEEEMISVPLVELIPETRGSYIQFLSDRIVEGTKTLLEHLEQPNPADLLDDDKYRLKKAIAILNLVKNQVYQYVGYY